MRSFIIFIIISLSLTGCRNEISNKNVKNNIKPNVLWIYLEDVSGWVGAYGDTIIKTPNIDKLASSGIRYDRFYTPAGVCSATRSAIITGMMQTTIGAHNHRSARSKFRKQKYTKYDKNDLPNEVVPLPIRFKEAGYWTFNDGGKDDYNFEWNADEFYDFLNAKKWGPDAFISGKVFENNTEKKPFFGQIQLRGGKLKNALKRVDRNKVTIPPYYPDIKEVREEIAYHYDCLLETDKQVGEIIKALKESGQYENTYIFMFSDHGMKLHRHKQFLYEGGIHMPFTLSGPGINANQKNKDLVSGIDISATSLAVAGIPVPENMEGQDVLGKTYIKRDYIIAARDRCDYTIEKIRAVVTPQFKYLKNYLTDRPYMQPNYKDEWEVSKKIREMIANGELNENQLMFFGDTKPAEELYDLTTNPYELNNLAKDPKFYKALKKHREFLNKWVVKTGDKGQQLESEIGLELVYQRWGEKCINPEYNIVKRKLEKIN